ncbi:MAG: type II toxin-antitoxin system Phd/YefM family antitoxin [Alphaproteobacteria bacterium]|nr:type II toxin-antitoxin system Phd/YefM family antitoxin [Alphaproteobacteria bacterium]
MDSIGAFEAKTHLSSLLERVARGEEFTITRRGQPVARLVPVKRVAGSASAGDTVQQLKILRAGHRLGGLSIRKLLSEGRR